MRKEIILSKINEIEESISLIVENIPEDFKNFKDLGLIKDGIYYRFQYSVENLLDICAIINSDLMLSHPKEEEDVIINLVKDRKISNDVGEKIKVLQVLRDQIEYNYGKIDDKLSSELINENLGDFDNIIGSIKKIIENF